MAFIAPADERETETQGFIAPADEREEVQGFIAPSSEWEDGQGAMTTAGNAFVSGAVDLMAKPFQALRNVQTTVGDLGQKYGGAPGRMLADTVTGGISNPFVSQLAADQATKLRAATQQAFPVDSERNPIAATVGGVIPQVGAMLGSAMALGPAAPLALMAPSEAQAGFETADQVGLTSPEARLGMAGGFAGMGSYIERLGGIGAKQAVGSLVKRGLKGVLSETLEEPATGAAQDLLTAAMGSTVLDPNNAGSTLEGYDLTQLDPRSPAYRQKRFLETVGGAVGGTMFAGVNALGSRGQPAPGQPPPLPPSDFSGTAPAPISPLSGIAQRAGRVDVTPLVPGLESEDTDTRFQPPGPPAQPPPLPAQPPPLPQDSPYAPPVPQVSPTPGNRVLGDLIDFTDTPLGSDFSTVAPMEGDVTRDFGQLNQIFEAPTPPTASVNEAIPTVPQRGPASVDPGIAGPTPATGALSPERIVSTGKPNGAQVAAVIDYVEASELEPLLLKVAGEDQTRDRANNRASAEQIASIATSPDAQLLGDSPVSSMGAPVVDDVILAGNGRAEGLIQGYRGGSAGMANYRNQIVQQAAAQGRSDVAAMKEPVMIRRVTNYLRGDRRSFVTESNPKYSTLQETVAEASLLDAEVLGDMSGIEFTQSGQLTSSSLQQVATKLKAAQRGINATTGGKPDVVEGTRRVQLASLAKLAKDNGVDVAELSGLLETDVGRRAVAEVSKAAPRLAALDPDLGLGDVMLSALRSFSEGARAVSQGVFKNLNEWADNRGQELIRDDLSPEAGQLLEIMIETVRTPTKLRELFDTYLEEATNEQDQRNQAAGSNDIFGDSRNNVAGKQILRRQMAGATDTAPATPETSGGQGDGKVGLTNLNPSGNTVVAVRNDGSTIIFDELINLAARAVQRGVTFAQWAADTVRRLGASVRDYLESAWQAATTRTMPRMGGGRVTVRRPEGGFIPNPLHRQGEPFRVKAQMARALLTGSPLPKGFTQTLDATDNERRSVDQTAAIIGQDLRVAVEAFAKRTGTPLADAWARVEPVMTGQPGALAGLGMLDANLAERARRARNNLDDLSQAVAQTMPAGNLRDAIIGNVGQWMRRGYAAFDSESGWSFDKVTAAAKAGKLIAGKDANLILSNARAYLRAQNPTATPGEIEAEMRNLMDRDTWQAALLGGTVKKAVGSLMRRKDIAPEIRALMGEETNPLHRYLQSAKFQAQLIARHHGQVAMRTIGLNTGLLKLAEDGVYRVEIPKEGHLWSGLGGTWTTPELMQALENSSGILQDGNTWGGWLVKTLKVLGNEAKLNRVALNPDSWLVNVLGGFVSTVQGGDIFATSFIRRMRDAGKTLGSSSSMQGKPFRRTPIVANALQDAEREMLARLTEQGVIGSTITLADIEASLPRHLLQWVADNQARDRTLGAAQGALIGQAMGRGLGVTGRVVGGAGGFVGGAIVGTQNLQKWRQKVAEWTMTKPDNLFRVTGWMTNYETALASGMQPDAAALWASERTLNTFPNYNALPAVFREFSKLGLVGSFIAFQHEVYRNTYWNIRYAVREVSSGNAAMQARGLQRLAGLTSIAALTFGGGLAAVLGLTGAAGADDERNKLFRKWFGAPWEKDAVLAFDKFSPTSVSYFNTSYLLPQITLQELAQAASEGADEGEAVQRVMGRLWEQFAGSSVHLGPIMAAMMNVDRSGRKITNRPGVAGALDRVDSAMTTIAEPGFAEKMTRIAYAIRGAERRGRTFSVKQELLRFFGLRGTERTWDTLVKGRYSRFGGEYQAIRDDANRVLGENLPGAQVQAVEEANARIAKLDADLMQFEAAMGRMGIEPRIIRAAKKDSAFSNLNPVRVRKDGKRVESSARR